MREELLKMARDYLNRVTVEELKRDLAECWVDGENIIKNKDSYNHNHIEYSIEEPHYFKDRNSECFRKISFNKNSPEYLGGLSWTILQSAS